MLVFIIVVADIFIIRYCTDMYRAKKQSSLLNNIKIDENIIIQSATSSPPAPQKTERMLQLEELQKENSDIVAWIEIEGTEINYPVLQTTDNDFYMNRDYKKSYSSAGSIFLDKDFSWSPKSCNFLIYGHNMKNGTMFQNLLKYKDKAFFDEHPTIRFTTNEEDSTYEIISVFQSRVYYKYETNVFRYYYFVNAETEDEYNNFVNNAKSASLYDTGKTATFGDQLITLSTCAYHTEDGRFVVVGRLKN